MRRSLITIALMITLIFGATTGASAANTQGKVEGDSIWRNFAEVVYACGQYKDNMDIKDEALKALTPIILRITMDVFDYWMAED